MHDKEKRNTANAYKPITNTAWVRTRLCKLQKGCTRLAAASDKVYQLLAHGWWFSPVTPASSTTKAGRHDIAAVCEIWSQYTKAFLNKSIWSTHHFFNPSCVSYFAENIINISTVFIDKKWNPLPFTFQRLTELFQWLRWGLALVDASIKFVPKMF
jgi:hypothetical protein